MLRPGIAGMRGTMYADTTTAVHEKSTPYLLTLPKGVPNPVPHGPSGGHAPSRRRGWGEHVCSKILSAANFCLQQIFCLQRISAASHRSYSCSCPAPRGTAAYSGQPANGRGAGLKKDVYAERRAHGPRLLQAYSYRSCPSTKYKNATR